MKTVFHIENLECRYLAGKTVLQVPYLQVPSGKTVFLLGPSGIGKSTFIEAVGLMNDTIFTNEKTKVQFCAASGKTENLKALWQQPDDRRISHFRNEFYSFIFQQTNLMPNFTAGENMCISQLIRGVPLEQARRRVLQTMRELNLDAEIFDKKITHLSGGQRQRVAFVRAINADFEVMFGDEPTGNLDKGTAFQLMKILKGNLARHQRTAIIVSHDLDLALHFADQLVLMTFCETATKEDRFGEILPGNILEKQGGGWHCGGQLVGRPEEFVQQIFHPKKTAHHA